MSIAPVVEIVGALMAERSAERDAVFAERRAERLLRFGPPEPTGYASSAAKCARQEGFRIGGVPAPDGYDTSALITFATGDFLHELVQEALVKAYDATIEVYFRRDGISGSADALYTLADGRRVVVEIKSVAPYPWEKALGLRFGKPSGKPEGPAFAHVLQAAICAIHLDAGFVHLIYVAKATGQIGEWRASLETAPPAFWTEDGEKIAWRPEGKAAGAVSLYALAEAECARQRAIVKTVASGALPARDYDPGKTKFPCGYCRWQAECTALPAGECDLPQISEESITSEPSPAGIRKSLAAGDETGDDGGGKVAAGKARTDPLSVVPCLTPSPELAQAYVRGCQEPAGVFVLGFSEAGNVNDIRQRIRNTIALAGWNGPKLMGEFEIAYSKQVFDRFNGQPHLKGTGSAAVKKFAQFVARLVQGE